MSISMKMLTLEEIEQEDLDILKAGTERSGHDALAMRDALLDGTAVMWRALGPKTRGVVITQENEYKGEKALFLWYLCGRDVTVEAVLHYQATLAEFARLRGLKVMWAKAHPKQYELVSKPAGWEIDEYIISKEV